MKRKQQTVLCVFGTRPEVIKMGPVVKQLMHAKENTSLDVKVCLTGQHREMVTDLLPLFEIEADYNLALMEEAQTLPSLTEKVLRGVGEILDRIRPDYVLVHGDTTTALGAAMAAFYRKIPIGHIEAGLRTYRYDSPFPEEWNRQAIDACSDLLFAPTQSAKEHLLREGKEKSQIAVTGNTAIDALRTTVRDSFTHPILDACRQKDFLLWTVHRRENHGTPLAEICWAVRKVLRDYPQLRIVLPLHPNPTVQRTVLSQLQKEKHLILCDPLDAVTFHNLLSRCRFVVTDSGGVQEEAPFLSKPVIVLRDVTERAEGEKTGALWRVGWHKEAVLLACRQLMEDEALYHRMANAQCPFGDGFAAERIVYRLCSRLGLEEVVPSGGLEDFQSVELRKD